MLRSSEQAFNPLDAIYFNQVRVLGILTLESQFRHKTWGIYLTQNAFVCPCGTHSANKFDYSVVLINPCWLFSVTTLMLLLECIFLIFQNIFLVDPSWLPILTGKWDKQEESLPQPITVEGPHWPLCSVPRAHHRVRVITGIKGTISGVKWCPAWTRSCTVLASKDKYNRRSR